MLLNSIEWQDNRIRFIDQSLLPERLRFVYCNNINTLWHAIRSLKIRGAPLIGVAVALGYTLAARNSKAKTLKAFKKEMDDISKYLRSVRPTAVNLFWALDRMERTLKEQSCRGHLSVPYNLRTLKGLLLKEALKILKEDRELCKDIGEQGSRLIKNGDVILTHCNAGILATAGYGTALSIFYAAKKQGKSFKVYVDETRPLLQGSRLTMWELQKSGIDATLITDSMAATTIKNKCITKIIVGADRIVRNGDVANKIGTYNLAILARFYKIPFYVAAPSSTIDLKVKSGQGIPIEERPKEELIFIGKRQIAPRDSKAYNPAFDITPAKLITAIITEKGIFSINRFRKVYR